MFTNDVTVNSRSEQGDRGGGPNYRVFGLKGNFKNITHEYAFIGKTAITAICVQRSGEICILLFIDVNVLFICMFLMCVDN